MTIFFNKVKIYILFLYGGITMTYQTYLEKLGKRLKKARIAKGLRQNEVADLLNITSSRVSHYENGRSTPSPEMLTEMAKLFTVSADYLLGVNALETKVPEEQLEVFRDRLNTLRIKQGFSRSELAKFVGVSEEQIKKWEFDCTELPTATNLFYLAASLGVTPDYLAGFVDTEQGISDEIPKPIDIEELLQKNLLTYSGIPITAWDILKIKQALNIVFFDSIRQKQKRSTQQLETKPN